MNQAASLVLGIVLNSLLENEGTYYIPKSGHSFVAGHHQPLLFLIAEAEFVHPVAEQSPGLRWDL